VALETWLAVAAALVFFMQGGFAALESGLVQEKNVKSVAFKNLIDCLVATPVFLMVGFALMFGAGNGFLGGSFFGLEGLPEDGGASHLFALYQLGFAATAVTIVSGAIAGRASFVSYVGLSVAVSLVVYPVFGHWAWGNLLVPDNHPWLVERGFVDFAGSTVVHSVGAWVGITAAIVVGPRLGRFDPGTEADFQPSSYGLSVLGVMILWFGWFGFNGGSVGSDGSLVGPVLLHTCLAGATAGLTAYAHAVLAQSRRAVPEKLVGGTLAGLVAITACCHVVTPSGALAVGGVAGVLHNLSYAWIARARIDDAVGVFPVHGVGGIWGTLCVALFGRADLLALPRGAQLGVQALGIVVCAVWSVGASLLILSVLRATTGLRVSPQEELAGVSVAGEMPPVRGESHGLSEAELLSLMGHDE